MKRSFLINGIAAVSLLVIPGSIFASPGGQHEDVTPHEGGVTELEIPEMSAERGRELFATKGCATCHSVNGVGGVDASPLDATGMEPLMNPFELAAKMWTMAPYMIAAQEEELGEQILFTGQELADIVAFLHDDTEQHKFTEEYLASLGIEVQHQE